MGIPVLIYGRSGTGKSRSLKNFGEDEITLVNVEKKPLPFRKKFKYIVNTDNYKTVCNALQKSPSSAIVMSPRICREKGRDITKTPEDMGSPPHVRGKG